MIFHGILQKWAKFDKISQSNTLILFNLFVFHYILLTFAFAFADFESLLQNFGLSWIGSKFGNL
jgi:hypothetical protein